MESVAKSYLPHQNGIVLVDLGCGTMPYRPLFQQYVSQYIGVDLPGNQIADSWFDSDGKTHLPDEMAHIVLSTQVLEHVERPSVYLRECYRLLKPDGLLVLSTHGYWMYHPDPSDFWRWTGSGLQKIVSEAGFQVIEIRGLGGLAATGLQLFQDGVTRRIPKILKPVFAFVMQSAIQILDRLDSDFNRSNEACVFVIIGRKVYE